MHKSKEIWIVLLVLVVITAIALVSSSIYLLAVNNKDRIDTTAKIPGCYTVSDVWKNASALSGKRICVEGKAETTIGITLLLCCPPTCDCNSSRGELSLVSEETITYNPRVSKVDYISIDSPTCEGNECSITCSPFNPYAAEYFQLVGELSTKERNGEIVWLGLTNLDVPASRQLIGRVWQTIPVETYVHTWPLATAVPNACGGIK